MRLSFIGMSGTGKSYWSSQLVERGFTRFCCDDMIAKRLGSDLSLSNGRTLTMGEWMGFPFHARYQPREAKYLTYEFQVLDEILSLLETNPAYLAEDVVIDTTGSVIYTGSEMLRRLHRQTTVIYLDTPLAVQEKMRAAYCANPAPVVWQDKFNVGPGETKEEALVRCYPDLLSSRAKEYRRWADVTLDYYMLRQKSFTVDDFLREISRVVIA